MKILIAVLILLSFLQATIIPLELVLIVLVLRSYIKIQRSNLILAFVFGLLISHLNFTPFGLQSLIFISLVQITHMLSKSPMSNHPVAIFPLVMLMGALDHSLTSLILGQSLSLWPKVFIEAVVSLPIYIAVRFWEERFTVKDIKLRIYG